MSFSGTYHVVINAPTGAEEGTLTLLQDADTLSGTMESRGHSADIENSRIEGEMAYWDIDITTPMPMTLSFEASRTGDNLAGTVKLGMLGSAEFEAKPA